MLELETRANYLSTRHIDTIYFGGGTPSVLSGSELEQILVVLKNTYTVSEDVEVTLEANPDDINEQKLKELQSLGINRLSIGIQSLNDDFLRFFNRAHNSEMAIESIEKSRVAGFDNLNVDLIFGIPGQSLEQFNNDLNRIIELDTEHISIYGLTIEENTVFGKWERKNKLIPIDEEVTANMFEQLMQKLTSVGFEHYEISNFAKKGFESRHNSNYWTGQEYLGIGPGAHSFDGVSRQFNISNNIKYINAISNKNIPYDVEILTPSQKINEYVLTRIRTSKGIDFHEMVSLFNFDLKKEFNTEILSYEKKGLIKTDKNLVLTNSGKLLADKITETLLVD